MPYEIPHPERPSRITGGDPLARDPADQVHSAQNWVTCLVSRLDTAVFAFGGRSRQQARDVCRQATSERHFHPSPPTPSG